MRPSDGTFATAEGAFESDERPPSAAAAAVGAPLAAAAVGGAPPAAAASGACAVRVMLGELARFISA